MKAYKIEISGRVHGVGYRYYTRQKAVELQLTGWVKNEEDGKVIIRAQGDKENLLVFIDFLKIGPPLSRVDKIEVQNVDILSEFNIFKVKF